MASEHGSIVLDSILRTAIRMMNAAVRRFSALDGGFE